MFQSLNVKEEKESCWKIKKKIELLASSILATKKLKY
jgi:hypothetical protein